MLSGSAVTEPSRERSLPCRSISCILIRIMGSAARTQLTKAALPSCAQTPQTAPGFRAVPGAALLRCFGFASPPGKAKPREARPRLLPHAQGALAYNYRALTLFFSPTFSENRHQDASRQQNPKCICFSKHEPTSPDGRLITQVNYSVLSVVICIVLLLLPPQCDQNF